MASSVTEEDIAKLREARYLTADVKHRLPAPEQIIPTLEPKGVSYLFLTSSEAWA